jgi:hypothetical protein
MCTMGEWERSVCTFPRTFAFDSWKKVLEIMSWSSKNGQNSNLNSNFHGTVEPSLPPNVASFHDKIISGSHVLQVSQKLTDQIGR